jgi:hypothetical protein
MFPGSETTSKVAWQGPRSSPITSRYIGNFASSQLVRTKMTGAVRLVILYYKCTTFYTQGMEILARICGANNPEVNVRILVTFCNL